MMQQYMYQEHCKRRRKCKARTRFSILRGGATSTVHPGQASRKPRSTRTLTENTTDHWGRAIVTEATSSSVDIAKELWSSSRGLDFFDFFDLTVFKMRRVRRGRRLNLLRHRHISSSNLSLGGSWTDIGSESFVCSAYADRYSSMQTDEARARSAACCTLTQGCYDELEKKSSRNDSGLGRQQRKQQQRDHGRVIDSALYRTGKFALLFSMSSLLALISLSSATAASGSSYSLRSSFDHQNLLRDLNEDLPGRIGIIQVQSPIIDEDSCYADLYASDAAYGDRDVELSSSEYVTFVNLQSSDDYPEAAELKDLPLELVLVFNVAACNCRASECDCPPGNTVDISGTDPESSTGPENAQQILNLFNLCKNVFVAIENLRQTQEPTSAPTTIPTADPTVTPTDEPTNIPTSSPTLGPTPGPSKVPSAWPTILLSLKPSSGPTVGPTSSPNLTPSQSPSTSFPTSDPSVEPTTSPLAEPTTPRPTGSPTSSPTNSPTVTPSAQPTSLPTVSPSALPTVDPTPYPSPKPTTFTGDIKLEFTYQISNNAGLTAQDIMDGVGGNTIKQDLVSATEELVLELLLEENEGQVQAEEQQFEGKDTSAVDESDPGLDNDVAEKNVQASTVGESGGGNERQLRLENRADDVEDIYIELAYFMDKGRLATTRKRNKSLKNTLFNRRKLEVTYNAEKPPTVDNVEDVDCPQSDGTSRCAKVYSTVTLEAEDESDPNELQGRFLSSLVNAINEGRLSDKLSPSSDIGDTSGAKISARPLPPPGDGTVGEAPAPSPGNTKSGTTETGLGTPLIVGIAVAAFVAGLFAVGGLYTRQTRRRRRRSRSNRKSADSISSNSIHNLPDDLGGGGGIAGLPGDDNDDSGGNNSAVTTLGAIAGDYGDSKSTMMTSQSSKMRLQELDPENNSHVSIVSSDFSNPNPPSINQSQTQNNNSVDEGSSDVSSSQAGSSGWSSSAGMSSINTGSLDGSSFDLEGAAGVGVRDGRLNTLAAMGIASGVSARLEGKQHKKQRGGRKGAAGAGGGGMQFIPAPAHQSPRMGAAAAAAVGNSSSGGSSDRLSGGTDPPTLEDVPAVPAVTRDDLDAAIEAGDWAAVGATAALLATTTSGSSVSGSVSGRSSFLGGSGSSVTSGNSTIDAERAAELDHLVDTGDWEGVVLAASKFESGSLGRSSGVGHGMSDDGSSLGGYDAAGESVDGNNDYSANSRFSRSGNVLVPGLAGLGRSESPINTPGRQTSNLVSGGGFGAGASSGSPQSTAASPVSHESSRPEDEGEDDDFDDEESSYSEETGSTSIGNSVLSPNPSTVTPSVETATPTPDQIAKRNEIRNEVEELVRRVVPDELDNVDEMMNQFVGREEELLETLRTMQERSIAQRERVARNKSAKREAKLEVRRARKMQQQQQQQQPGSVGRAMTATTGSLSSLGSGGGLPPAGPRSAGLSFSPSRGGSGIGNGTGVSMGSVVGVASSPTGADAAAGIAPKRHSGGTPPLPPSAPSPTRPRSRSRSPKVPKDAAKVATAGTTAILRRSQSSEESAGNSSDSKFDIDVAGAANGGSVGGTKMSLKEKSTDVTAATAPATLKYDADESENEHAYDDGDTTEGEDQQRQHKSNQQNSSRRMLPPRAPPPPPPPPPLSDTSDVEKTPGTTSSGGSVKRARHALERAIEAGDWEAVGEAAALMSDNSVTSADTSELRDIANISGTSDYESSAAGSNAGYTSAEDTTRSGASSRRTGSTGTSSAPNSERAAALDGMIERGDWEGVVLAARSFSKMDSEQKRGTFERTTKSQRNSNTDDSNKGSGSGNSNNKPVSWRLRRMFGGKGNGSGNGNGNDASSLRSSQASSADTSEHSSNEELDSITKKKSDMALQEEQDALAQAEIWMAIAAQSKQEGANEPTGASDAADWAISRSLSALQKQQNQEQEQSAIGGIGTGTPSIAGKGGERLSSTGSMDSNGQGENSV